ncbi:MAG TPA: exosortase A [Methylomirabilota bacterium]|jgi:exosortase
MSIAAPADVVAGASPSWRSLAILGAIFFVVLGVLYSTVLRDLVAQWWDDDNYSHGFLVPLFTGYLIWQRRHELRTMPICGSALGWPVLVAGVGMLILGDVGAENFLLRSSLILILTGLVLVHLGRHVFRAVAFPLAFLFFAVPLPAIIFYKIAFPLQGLAAQNSAWALDLLGVPVLLDGNVIHLSRLSLGVVEACSGIRSLISLVALAVAWAYLTLPSTFAMAVLIAASIPITIAANAARIVATGLIGQSFGMEYAQGFFHTFSGWVIFVFAFVCLLGVHALIRMVSAAWRRRSA